MIDITTFSNNTKITNRQFLVGKPVSECLFFVHFRRFALKTTMNKNHFSISEKSDE